MLTTWQRPLPFTKQPPVCGSGGGSARSARNCWCASSAVYLLVKRAGTKPSAYAEELRRYQRHWTPVHLDFVVDDVNAAVNRAIAAGATIEGEIETHSWGRIANLADPFGHGICFIEFRGRGYDEIASVGEETG